MTAPITWQNINAPSFGEANRLMGLAQQSILGAFDGAKTVLADSQAFDKELWKRQDQDATQDALAKIYQAQNVQQFNALNQSGVLDQAVAANGARIDRAAVNALRDGRLSTLQQRDKQAGEFADWTTTREQRPIVNGIMTDIYSGNTKRATEALANNPNLLNAPEIQKTLTDYKRKLVLEGRDDTRWSWDQESQKWKIAEEAQKALLRPFEVKKAQSALDTAAAQREAYRAQAGAANEQRLTSAANRDRIEAETARALALNKLGTALEGNIYKEGVYKDTDSVDIAKLMKDTGAGSDGPNDADQRRKVLERINKLAQTGIQLKGPDGKPAKGSDGKPLTVPLPLGAVKAALLSSGDQLWSWNEGYADSFESNLKARLEAVYNKPGPDGKPIAANQAADDWAAYKNIMRNTAEIAPVSASSTKRK